MLFSLSFFPLGKASAAVPAPLGYTLIRVNVSPRGTHPELVTFQWVAVNHSSVGGNFFISEKLPVGTLIQSIQPEGDSDSPLFSTPSLPATGPASLLVGPFFLNANSSVTFNVLETVEKTAGPSDRRTFNGETFSLLSQTHLAGKNSSITENAESLLERAGTPTPALTTGRGLVQTVVAVPNISRNDQPINFIVNLNSPAQIALEIFALTGEMVYTAQAQGITGPNSLKWNLQNSASRVLASGLYFYDLQVTGDGAGETRTGKVLIIH